LLDVISLDRHFDSVDQHGTADGKHAVLIQPHFEFDFTRLARFSWSDAINLKTSCGAYMRAQSANTLTNLRIWKWNVIGTSVAAVDVERPGAHERQLLAERECVIFFEHVHFTEHDCASTQKRTLPALFIKTNGESNLNAIRIRIKYTKLAHTECR
jgi:hypothetical protein